MRADARRNYERLIAAARDAYAEYGAEAHLDDIARRAGVGPGTLYRHFPSREALLAAVYRGDVEALAERAKELSSTLSPGAALDAWLRLQLDYIKTKRGLGSAVKAMLGADSETLAFCRDTMRGALRDLLGQAQEAGVIRPDVDAPTVLRLVHGVGIASESVPDQADRLLSIMLDGLRPLPPAASPPA
ncbi:helix-turn-helix domain-containing protein [Phytohabitans sp. ZYX-F-186]|uniref:Helix-turn-helix domain-containing protein n=1 Tax=Phytohabitans maris TaxID=3071409 RepID=A0ABU0ZM48_9ACTN|nr:helix-turn-helix domain-containing protein [Phytohabitans sp. ZYX-F-186]MDQ7907701.1 helix-turn-helix domain-containing protein [Phytohabitans sp. ZYX-F-186]